jgi:hypothetical protein
MIDHGALVKGCVRFPRVLPLDKRSVAHWTMLLCRVKRL